MKQFLYPAIFFKLDDEYRVVFPDLDISTDGKTYEEAYMFAKDLLRVYFIYVLKHDLDFNLPSSYDDMTKICGKDEVVTMIDAIVGPKDVK